MRLVKKVRDTEKNSLALAYHCFKLALLERVFSVWSVSYGAVSKLSSYAWNSHGSDTLYCLYYMRSQILTCQIALSIDLAYHRLVTTSAVFNLSCDEQT